MAQKMNAYVYLVKMHLFKQFTKKLKGDYGELDAKYFAGALTNKLFGETPPNERAHHFFVTHKNDIKKELLKIKESRSLCKLVTQTWMVNAVVAPLRRDPDESLPDLLSCEELKKIGIWVSEPTLSAGAYREMIEKYFKKKIGDLT